MKQILYTYIIISCCFFTSLFSVPHVSSYPYITSDTFRQFCTFVLDEDSCFDPVQVKKGDTLFIKPDFFHVFFQKYHPFIQHPYVLISHDSDLSVPGNYKQYLDDEKIFVWLARNVDYNHPKLIHIPIGFNGQLYENGNIKSISRAIQKFANNKHPKKLLYLNFGITHQERRIVFSLFSQCSFCTMTTNPKNTNNNAGKKLGNYLIDIAHHKFTLSPRGNGLDCHRTWEALIMGSYPIVRTTTLDPLYKDLPVVIVNNYTEVTQEFLQTKYEEMKNKPYKLEKLYAPYWFNLIANYQEQARKG